MFHFLRRRVLFHSNNIKTAAAAAPTLTIQSLQNPFFVRECHYTQTIQQPSSLADYLRASLGFSAEEALKVSKQLTQNVKNPDLIPTFLKSHGFSTTQIKSIIKRQPCLLHYAFPESKLVPKIQFFKENGFSDSDIEEVLVKNPGLFSLSLERRIKPFFDLTRGFLGRDEFVFKLLCRQRLRICPDTWSTNMMILKGCSIKDDLISKALKRHPHLFNAKPERFNEIVEMVKGMGFSPLSSLFMHAIDTMVCLSRLSWDMKLRVYRSVGWSDEEILSAFRKQPACMRLSEKKIKEVMDYFTKELGWDPSYISNDPKILCYSLEKRIIPRHRFLQFLASKGCIKKGVGFFYKFVMSEQRFLDECVTRYESQVPDVLQIYKDLVTSNRKNVSNSRYISKVPDVASWRDTASLSNSITGFLTLLCLFPSVE